MTTAFLAYEVILVTLPRPGSMPKYKAAERIARRLFVFDTPLGRPDEYQESDEIIC